MEPLTPLARNGRTGEASPNRDEPLRLVAALQTEVGALRAEIAALWAENAELKAQVAE